MAPAAGLLGLLLMLGSWAALIRLTRSHRLRIRTVAAVAAAWSLPVLLAGPVISSDVYAYGGIGELMSRGFDPYTVGPAALGHSPFLTAMDPGWAHAPAPYGPVALLGLRLAVWAGRDHFTATLWVLRVGLAAAACAAAALAVAATPARRRAAATAVAAACPLVTVGLIGSSHIDALALVFAAGAALAWQRRHCRVAVALAGLATAVKAPFGLLVATFVIAALAREVPGRRVRRGAQLLAVAAGAYLVPALAVGRPWELLPALSTPYGGVGIDAPAAAVSFVIGHVVGVFTSPAGLVDAVLFSISVTAGLVLVGRALAAAPRRNPTVCAGLALGALALTSPILHSWYLTWALLLITPLARDVRAVAGVAAATGYTLLIGAVRLPLADVPASAVAIGVSVAAAYAVAAALRVRPAPVAEGALPRAALPEPLAVEAA